MTAARPPLLLSERQTGGPEVANSHAPKARGQGYGAAGPMFDRRATRAPRKGPGWIQADLFGGLPEAPKRVPRASGAPHGAARSAA